MINDRIFKANDIRGIYPEELDDQAAYQIGRAVAYYTNATEIIVGRDMRLSSPILHEKLVQGIIDQGATVVDIDVVPIDAVYFAVHKLGYAVGIMITASHNPKDYNGFKVALPGIELLRGVKIREIIATVPDELPAQPGAIIRKDILPEFIQHVLTFADVGSLKPLKVVVDAGSGLAGKIIPLLSPHLPIAVVPMNFELDGNFPAHPSNPLLPESQEEICQRVVNENADLGVIFDGDTDRLIIIDENGRVIRADYTLLLLAKEFLRRDSGATIIYNAICSKIVSEKITQWGGQAVRCKVGFTNVAQAVRDHNGVMGGELSGHYCFRDNGYADSGFVAFLLVLEILSQENKPLSEIVSEFYKYAKAEEINITTDHGQKIIDILQKKYVNGQQDELDGLTVSYDNWWFNVRLSNTEPLLRITVEADTSEVLAEKIKEIQSYI